MGARRPRGFEREKVAILEIVVVLLVFLNGFFAMSELAIVSSCQGRLERLLYWRNSRAVDRQSRRLKFSLLFGSGVPE
jgi:CBS domain containing-hemolysin-like protein